MKLCVQGHGMSALHLNDSSISAHAILAGGYDVVVTSYEFVEANASKKTTYEDKIEAYSKAGDHDAAKPKKPTTALATGLWALTGLIIKRGYMDEAHVVNKRDGKRHLALVQLPVSSWCLMSGTLPHNRWHDISGYLDFVKGHPYTSHEKFMAQFSAPNYTHSASRDIGGAQLLLLQRFLQALIVIRPRDVLKLPPCRRLAFPLDLTNEQAGIVCELTEKYKMCCGMGDQAVTVEDTEETNALGLAIRAQMHCLHPRLAPPSEKDDFELDREVVANTTAAKLNKTYSVEDISAAEKRKQWLQELDEWTVEMFDESPHLFALTHFLDSMIKRLPDEKLVVFSQYLKYLDIVELIMRKRFGVKCLRYDGTVGQIRRVEVQKEFSNARPPRPLLITAGAGSTGLNLTSGRVVVLTEEWWNASIEAQAISRCHRQGVKGEVTVVKFHIKNSAIDAEISRVRESKIRTNTALMARLIHKHDEIPTPVQLLY